MKAIKYCLFVTAIMLFWWSSSFACLFTKSWDETFDSAKFVVSGKVIAKEKIPTQWWLFFEPDEELQFSILATHKGVLTGDSIMLLHATNTSCGTDLFSGWYYTLYLDDNRDSEDYPAHHVHMLNVRWRVPNESQTLIHKRYTFNNLKKKTSILRDTIIVSLQNLWKK